jgi:hypothetical protein
VDVPDPWIMPDLVGDYVFSLIVGDGMALSLPDTMVLHVSLNLPPVAVLQADVTSGEAPLTVHFDGTQSFDPEGADLWYTWNFGDFSDYPHDPAVVHTYELPGSYLAKLQVLDDFEQVAYDWVRIEVVYPAPVAAVVDVDPDVLNPRSGGRWITCYIELPEAYDPGDIDVSTVILNETVPAEMAAAHLSDCDGDGIADLTVKFSRSAVIGVLPSGEQVEVRVSGEVAGQPFAGADTIRVLMPRVSYANGGEVLETGYDCAITWDVPAGYNPAWYSVYYTTDDGNSWNVVAEHVEGTSCSWVVPGIPSAQCRVLVEAYDAEGIMGYDISDGTFTVGSTSGVPAGDATPAGFALYASSPNPFTQGTVIRFDLPERSHVKLSLLDVHGRLIRELVDEVRPASSYSIDWDVRDTSAGELPAGIYFVRFEAGTYRATGKIVLAR